MPTPTQTFDEQLSEQFTRVPIYTDSLVTDWTLKNSFFVDYDEETTLVDTGSQALEVRPQAGTTVLRFSLQPSSKLEFPRKKVAAVHFRLSGGNHPIQNNQLYVSMSGSNQYTYWDAKDTSVTVNRPVTEAAPLFSETQLVFLGFQSDIPANTWVDVTVWLNDLLYEPEYNYVTGFSIKVDSADIPSYYLDNVELLLWPE